MNFTGRRGIMRQLLGACLAVVVVAGCTGQATPSPSVMPPSPSEGPRTPRPTPTPSPEPTPTPAPTPTPSPTPTPLNEALLDQRITVLILGLDQNRFRARYPVETNTDAMVLASVSSDHTQISTVSLPRDTVDLPLADGSVWTNKANSITRFLGIEGLRGAFETSFGVEIDYYVQIDMDDFAWLVNKIGGVDVQVPYDIYDPGYNLFYGVGPQHLTGEQALIYTRTRAQDGDYARQLRQQQVLLAIAQRLTDPEADINFLSLLPLLPSIQTDIPLEDIPTLIEVARLSREAEVSHQVLGAPQGYALFEGLAGARGWVMVPNIPAMRGYVQSVMGGD